MKRKALSAVFLLALLSVAYANALAQDAPPVAAPAPPAAEVVASAADAAPAAPFAVAAPALAPAPPVAAVAPALAAVDAAPAAQEAPVAPAAPAEAPEPQAGFANTFFDDGNYLGVRVEELTRENMSAYKLTGEPRGVGVSQVLKGSPAERAGLREHDVIVRFDGEAVTSVRKLNRLIAESSPDHTARITVLRDGSEQEVSATLARRDRLAPAAGARVFGFDPEEARRFGEEWSKNADEWKLQGGDWGRKLGELQRDGSGVFVLGASRRIGLTTTTLGKQLADYFGVAHGVLISSVEKGGPADKAGLRAGDVVTEADGRAVEDASDLVRALGAKEDGDVTLTVVREKKQRTVRVTPERRQSPQGFFTTPGAVNIAPPVASIAPRVYAVPRAWVAPNVIRAPYVLKDPDFITPPAPLAPHALSAPPVIAAPRVRVAPRVTIVTPGGSIL